MADASVNVLENRACWHACMHAPTRSQDRGSLSIMFMPSAHPQVPSFRETPPAATLHVQVVAPAALKRLTGPQDRHAKPDRHLRCQMNVKRCVLESRLAHTVQRPEVLCLQGSCTVLYRMNQLRMVSVLITARACMWTCSRTHAYLTKV